MSPTIIIKCHLCDESFTAEVAPEEMDGYRLNNDGTYNGADAEHCCDFCAYEDEYQITKDWQYR